MVKKLKNEKNKIKNANINLNLVWQYVYIHIDYGVKILTVKIKDTIAGLRNPIYYKEIVLVQKGNKLEPNRKKNHVRI